jgi:hypothetical protein
MNRLKYIIIGFFSLVLIIACSNDTDSFTTTKIDGDDAIYKFLSSENTFDESHSYYLKMKNERGNEDRFDNLKTLFVADLIEDKNLYSIENKEIIAFYVEEINELDFFYLASGYSSLLHSLEGYWSNEKLNQYANDFISRNGDFVSKLPNPEKLRKDTRYVSGLKKMQYTEQYFQFRS